MPDIPILNETDYALTEAMFNQIQRDALEYFGESIRTIRVQYGIERHAFNARTGELRYSFSPGDFGLIDTIVSLSEPYQSLHVPSIDDIEEDESDDVTYDDVEVDEEDDATASLESLAEDLDDTEDEPPSGFQGLEDELTELETDDDDDDDDLLYSDEDTEEDEYA